MELHNGDWMGCPLFTIINHYEPLSTMIYAGIYVC